MNRHAAGNGQVFPKYKIPVRIRFADQSIIIGAVFIRQGQRVLDMICDERQFFPIATTTGITLANKAQVKQIDVLGLPEIVDMQESLPEFDLNYVEKSF